MRTLYSLTFVLCALLLLAAVNISPPAIKSEGMAGTAFHPDPKAIERGRLIFDLTCSPCHGKEGKGDGPLAANFRTRPRDLTTGVYMNRSTASGELPTDYDLYRSVTMGLHNTPMPTFHSMSSDDRWAVVQYLKTLSPRFKDTTEYPLDVLKYGTPAVVSPLSLAAGRSIYVEMKCGQCHGENGAGDGPSGAMQADDFGNSIRTANLTNPSDYKFARSVLDVYRIFSTGLNGAPMPSYASTLTETERWNLANYVWALQDLDQYRDDFVTDSSSTSLGQK